MSTTILTLTLPGKGVSGKLLDSIEDLLRAEYADHPWMRRGFGDPKNRRVWEVEIRVEPYKPDRFDDVADPPEGFAIPENDR